MRVLVTGASGFVGRLLTWRLADQGHDVAGIDYNREACHPKVSMTVGNFSDKKQRERALGDGCDALVHLAAMPGGAAETDPIAARRINIDASYDLLVEASALNPGVRVVFASSIAVFGDRLPSLVDDRTLLSPKMLYGGHKAMIEQAIAMFSNCKAIDGVSLRLSGILGWPRGPSGMKSAFMSELFHALKAGQPYICPVSKNGTVWVQSVERCTTNLLHALELDTARLPPTRAVTLPALRIRMEELVHEIADQCGV